MPIIIPALPTRPAPNVSAGIQFSGLYSLASGSYSYFDADSDNRFLFNASSLGLAESINNAGTLWIRGAGFATVLAANNFGSIANSGVIVAEALAGNAIGIEISSGWLGTLNNSGSIFAIAMGGSARAWSDWSSNSAITNSGVIAALTDFGGAFAILRANGGSITNTSTGQILAEGQAATAIYTDGSTNGAAPGTPMISNAGLIHAVSTHANLPSAAIFVKGYTGAGNAVFAVHNSGTIRGDYAFYVSSFAYSPPQKSAEQFTNTATGLVEGDMVFDLGNDVLINAGQIVGTIDMGNGNDSIDSGAGSITGLVYLGEGNDSYIGGSAADVVMGDRGDDQITGNGGNDLLVGDRGDDVINGGAGNDGLFGSYGNDTLHLLGGDFALGGEGDDRFVIGDYSFELANGELGFDTLVLPNVVRVLDLSLARTKQRLADFEAVEMQGGTKLVVRSIDVSGLTGGETVLQIKGTASDSVSLVGNWVAGGSVSIGGTTFNSYTADGATVLVAAGLTATVDVNPPAGAIGLDSIAAGGLAPLAGDIAGTGLVTEFTFSANYEMYDSLTIEPGEIWYTEGTAAALIAWDSSITLNNAGTLLSSNPTGDAYTAQIQYLAAFNNTGAIIAEAGIDPTYTYDPANQFDHYHLYGLRFVYNNTLSGYQAIAYYNGSTAPLVNHGLIDAYSGNGIAIGAISWTPDFEAGGGQGTFPKAIVNFGTISAESGGPAAVAAYMENAGRVENSGTITAIGAVDAVGIYLSTHASLTINTGLITVGVSGVNARDSYGVYYDNFGGRLTNSGTITAEFAVYSLAGSVDLNNSGQINGAIKLSEAVDTIVNSGTISGPVNLGAGNDTFDGRTGTASGKIAGEAGNDTLRGGNGIEWLDGGDGDDTIEGGAGDDRLDGGSGLDSLTGGAGNDTIFGGTGGSDVARYAGNRSSYLIDTATVGGIEYVRVTGQGSAAGEGVDLLRRIETLQFADMQVALPDTANYRPALGAVPIADQIIAEGGSFNYQVPAGSFIDSDPDDVLTYSAALADGSPLPIWLTFNPATRTFTGTGPNGSFGSVLQVRISATDGFPGDPGSLASDIFALTIDLGPGPDILGTPLDDNMVGTFRPENMFGAAGNDTIYASEGGDLLDGQDGTDVVSFTSSNAAVTVNLATGTGTGGHAQGDRYVSIESVYGSAYDDNLTGSSGDNELWGGNGNDFIDGGDGNDFIFGASGTNTLQGGAGNDRFSYLLGTGGNDSVNGGSGTDTLIVNSGIGGFASLTSIEAVEFEAGSALTLTGAQFATGLAANTAFSGTGAVTVNMGATDLELSANTMSVAAGSTITLTVNGSSSGEIIKGLTGAVNTINGGGGGDQIRGGAQADFIFGGDGNDKLAGGQGADQLNGGAGVDQFRFQSSASSGIGAAADRIADFTTGSDLLVFRQIDTDPLTVGDQAFAFIGTAAFGASGAAQMRYANSGADLLVQADINGDGIADMEVLLLGLAGQPLNGSDFLL